MLHGYRFPVLPLACAVLLSALPPLARASALFPIDAGRVWLLEDGATRRVLELRDESEVVTEETSARGLRTEVRWGIARDGSVFLLGYRDEKESFIFEPALLWLPADPVKGDEWTNRAEVFNSDGKPVASMVHTRFVVGEEKLEFKWGSVEAVRIDSIGDRPPLASIGSEDGDPTRTPWVIYSARDLGLVRRGGEDGPWIDVIGFGYDFVSTESTSWGATKARYSDTALPR